MDDHLYLVTYDISDAKRWRAVFKLMSGHGDWLQLSVFQCRLTRRRHTELIAALEELIHHKEDHVLVVDLGPTGTVEPRVSSLGKAFSPVKREAVVI